MSEQLLLGLVFGVVIATASYYARFLTLSGSLATFVLAVVVYGIGGWKWTVPILTFFVLSSLLSRWEKQQKQSFESTFEKSSIRDAGQVAANGGVAGILVVVSYFVPSYDCYPLYVGAIAAVTADTWGTEIGTLTHGKTVSVLTLKPVEIGTSGGVSYAGLFGGVLGCAVIAFVSSWWVPDLGYGMWVVIAGFLGSLVDSFLGATVQAQYQCAVCGKLTEKKIHCGMPARLVRGFAWVTNDIVNWACALVGAAVMMVICTIGL